MPPGENYFPEGMPAVELVPADRARPGRRRSARSSTELKKQEMIDIQLLRKDPRTWRSGSRRAAPARSTPSSSERFEATRKQLQTAVEQAQASRNRIAKDIGQAKAQGPGRRRR